MALKLRCNPQTCARGCGVQKVLYGTGGVMNGARRRKEALPQWLYRAGEVVTTLVAGPRGVTVKRGGGDHRTDCEERWWGSQD